MVEKSGFKLALNPTKSKKTTHFNWGLWLRSLDYSPDLFLGWPDPMSGQEETQEDHFCHPEGALFRIHSQLSLLKPL